jgi:uncharacterized membrane-anchored protein
MDLSAEFGVKAENKPDQDYLDPSLNQLKPKESIPRWRFWVSLLLQIGLIAAVPAQAIHTHLSGKTVILQTAPVDPYSQLKGYYQVLSYDISRPNNLKELPGWTELRNKSCQQAPRCPKSETFLSHGTNIYVVLAAPNKDNKSSTPQPWQPVKISYKYPENLSSSEIAIRGKYLYGTIKYGLENYYMPEKEKEKVNQAIGEARENSRNTVGKEPYLVEVKVNSQGKAIPISLWINQHNYRF